MGNPFDFGGPAPGAQFNWGIPELSEGQYRFLSALPGMQRIGAQQQAAGWNNLLGASSSSPLAANMTFGSRMQNAMGQIGALTARNAAVTNRNNAVNSMLNVLRGGGGFGGGGAGGFSGFNFTGPSGERFGGVSMPGEVQVGIPATPGSVWGPGFQQKARTSLGNVARGAAKVAQPAFPGANVPNVTAQYADMPVGMAGKTMSALDMAGARAEADQLLAAQKARANLATGGQGLLNRIYGNNLADDLEQSLMTNQVLRSLYDPRWLQGAGSYEPMNPFV